MDKLLTLISVKLAKKNRKFLFTGPVNECENCNSSLKSVCIENLEKGCIYEIVEIRKVIHSCPIHEGGVTVVEVKKPPIKIAIDAKLAYEGATISYNFPDCDEKTCKNFEYCKPIGIIKEAKYKIIKKMGTLPHICSKGKRLHLVEIIS